MGTDEQLTIVFADVVGSTQLYEALGDDSAREAVQQCVEEMKEATEAHGGLVIKTMGDEVMATFTQADEAMNAASQMQQRISTLHPDGAEEISVAIRIGCHYGHVVVESRDIFGAAVITANRMTSQAKAGQIVTTADTVEQLGQTWKGLVRQIGVAPLRGLSEDVALYEVLWQPEEATSMLPKIDWAEQGAETPGRLHLRWQGQELAIGEGGSRSVTLGRAETNDITVKGNLISRIHARIDVVKNRFVLIDQSTNGTFVQRDDGEEIYVRRDTTELTGSGLIGLGRVAARGTPLAVEYSLDD